MEKQILTVLSKYKLGRMEDYPRSLDYRWITTKLTMYYFIVYVLYLLLICQTGINMVPEDPEQ